MEVNIIALFLEFKCRKKLQNNAQSSGNLYGVIYFPAQAPQQLYKHISFYKVSKLNTLW